MKFFPEHFTLAPPKDSTQLFYNQKVNSEITLKGITKKQEVLRSLRVEISPEEAQSSTVSITTQKEILKLDSILKKQENISNEISKTIDFVQLKLNAFGEPIRILNQEDILEKWYEVRIKLERDFKGKAMGDYLDGIETKLKNHEALLKDFKQYRLFGGLFPTLYFEHSSIPSKLNQREQKIENFIFSKSVVFKESILLDKILEDEISLKISADLDEEIKNSSAVAGEFRTRNLFEQTSLKLKRYSGSYVIDKESGMIKTMNLDIDSTYGSEYQKTIHYSLTQDKK